MLSYKAHTLPAPLQACTGQGYQVISTDEGEKALSLAAGKKPDLIFLDVILPGQNGFQVCRQLKKSPETEGVKVILVTSKSQPNDKFWGTRQGADEFITKPYSEDDLRTVIARLI